MFQTLETVPNFGKCSKFVNFSEFWKIYEAQGAGKASSLKNPFFSFVFNLFRDVRAFFEPVRADSWRIDVDFSRGARIRPRRLKILEMFPHFPFSVFFQFIFSIFQCFDLFLLFVILYFLMF